MLNEWGPCRIAAIAHPNKPIVQYAQISWMGDYRYGRKRCSICDKSVYKPKAQAAPEPSSAEVPKTFRPDFEIGSKGDLTAEVDGDWKDPEEPYYKKRDAYMESIGIRVMRFSNRSVLHDGKGVIKAIQLELSRVKHL